MNEASEILRYSVNGPTEEEKKAARSPGDRAMTVFNWGILVVCLGVWAVVGALFWVPLLLRRVVEYSVALVPSMLAVGKPWRAAKRLRNAMSFYARGFKVTTELVTRDPKRSERPLLPGNDGAPRGTVLFGELVWAVLIWYPVLLLAGVVQSTPLDLWQHLGGISWREDVLQPFLEWVRTHHP
jgi:hypothetical protein